MKKARNGFVKNLRYLCLIGVIVLGLMTIVGTGCGGDGGGGTTATDTSATTDTTTDDSTTDDTTTDGEQAIEISNGDTVTSDSEGKVRVKLPDGTIYEFQITDESDHTLQGIKVNYSEENDRRRFVFFDESNTYVSGLLFGTNSQIESRAVPFSSGLAVNYVREDRLIGTVIFVAIALYALTKAQLTAIDGMARMQTGSLRPSTHSPEPLQAS